jgi:hypothetical protein
MNWTPPPAHEVQSLGQEPKIGLRNPQALLRDCIFNKNQLHRNIRLFLRHGLPASITAITNDKNTLK